MLSTGAIDWLGVTFSSNFDETHLHHWIGPFKNIGKASHGYERLAVSTLGATMISDGPERLGRHLDIPGACWQAMRDEDRDVDAFPAFCLEHGGKATRLDLCVDMHGCETNVGGLFELASLGQIKTRARELKRMVSQKDDGFYIGAKKSDKFMRVYDKRLEQGTPAAPTWVRLELQMRKRYAVEMTVIYAEQPDKRKWINAAIQDYCDFPLDPDVQAALRDIGGVLPVLNRKPPKFVKWLMNQVIPAMLNFQEQHPDTDVLRMFSLLYQEQLNQRK